MSHPALGLRPPDFQAAHPAAAAAVRTARARLAARALEIAVDADPSFRTRYPELGLRELLADTEAMTGRLAAGLGSGDRALLARWADMVVPRFRKRGIAMDDAIRIAEGLRSAARSVSGPDAHGLLDGLIEEAVAAFRWHRRLAGDARRRNPLLAFLYKGA